MRRFADVIDDERKSILLLGGSQQQVVAIEAAKHLGYRTVLCDYLPDNPGQYAADVFYLESTTDFERMLEIARAERVSGVLAYASDPAAMTAAYVSERLGLPGNPMSAVETLSEKHRFRAHLAAIGLPCPKAVPIPIDISPEEVVVLAEDMRLPVVLKPTDSSGSKGVSILDDLGNEKISAALAHAKSFSRNGTLVLEEFIRSSFPRVIGGDIFVVDGEVRFWGLMSCLRDEGLGGLVPIGERSPSGLDSRQLSRVRELIQKLVSSLGVRCGELNVEVIMGRDDTPYLLELGARAGGNMIPVQLSDISGIDLVEANVRAAMGDESLDVSFDGSDEAFATYVLHSCVDGVFHGVELSPEIAGHVYRRVMYVEPGDSMCVFDGANKALGILFLRFDDVAQMEALLSRIQTMITIY